MCCPANSYDAERLHTMSMIDGERLLIERRRIGMTQDTLARLAGVSRVYISQIENNRDVDVGIRTLYAIAKAIGVSPLYLLGETEDPLRGVDDSATEDEAAPPNENNSLPVGGSELLELLGELSERGRNELLSVARAIHEVDQQYRDNERVLTMIEAMGGMDFVVGMNQLLAVRASQLGSTAAAMQEIGAQFALFLSEQQAEHGDE